MQPRRKKSPSGRMYVVEEGYTVCDYCVWKGDEGPGKQLREMLKEEDKDVHTEHCCVACGCKYGEKNCPVVLGDKKQSHPCGNMFTCQ